MDQDANDFIENIDSTSQSLMEYIHPGVTCLLDLPNEILLQIFRYLSLPSIFHSFSTSSQPELRLHRLIHAYYNKMKLDGIINNDYIDLANLFSDSNISFRPQSLILNNKNVNCIIQRFLAYTDINIIKSIFAHLRYLTLIDCSSSDLRRIQRYNVDMTLMEYLHIVIRTIDEDLDFLLDDSCDATINQFLFGTQISSLHEVIIHTPDGLMLRNSLVPNESLRHIDIALLSIDDLYILLDGLVPNVEKLIIQLLDSQRLPGCYYKRSMSTCSQLTEFTLLEDDTRFLTNHIKRVFDYMSTLIKLTLSIRDTPDSVFINGPKFESILIKYLPNLRQFNYTVTQKVSKKKCFKDFIQWPMDVVYYKDEKIKYMHVFSLPWPFNKDDKRKLPFVEDGYNTSVTSNVKQSQYMKNLTIIKSNDLFRLNTDFSCVYKIITYLSINIKLPPQITKLVITDVTRIASINSIIQPSIRHLTVERVLKDETEIGIYARQFPNVKYLKLFFPYDEFRFINCLQTVFTVTDKINENRRRWPQLINFSTRALYNTSRVIFDENDIHHWLISKTDLKYIKNRFYADKFDGMLFIWF
ncbi:unnamed protein product [Adineta steineri]|uniref:F-box domain-containing protein n=1 Tax=Adineta steineri TaxID=433720 RepID=A0A818HIA3_9BILA|nr:unnamed protein product [Adineta steineri]CAF3505210.1 unnamed protein product [Adineta steineri]